MFDVPAAPKGLESYSALADALLRYNSHNTRLRLSELTAQKLSTILPDKEGRKSVLNAVKGIASGQVSLFPSHCPLETGMC